ncbi:MAG TPA: hypothetical protein VGN95_17800 [Pyrinomonadaceae bacterium]|jgi:hypothetical protein|nr:hypothetical protein [Pyrinomonadaceae bacterium]
MNYRGPAEHSRALSISIIALLLFVALCTGFEALAQNTQARTPTETVREFYKAMREKRFREAFGLSIYKPALDGLSAEEFEELRPDFEKMAAAIPEKIDVSGEQTSGDVATVFVKISDADKADQPEPVGLMREGGAWIVGDRENQEIVRKAGKQFFFQARIETHHSEVQAMLQRISLVQLAYASQHNDTYADLPTLIAAGLVPKDIETTDTTGYHFHLALAKDAKSWTAGAEPVRYGRTGRLSFFMDQTGIRSADVGGKLLTLPAEEKR